MSDDRREEELRARFQASRANLEASGRVPDFDSMMARARAEAEAMPPLKIVEGGAGGSADSEGRDGASRDSARREGRAERGRARVVKIGGWVSLATAAAAAGLLLIGPPVDDADLEFERLVNAYTMDVSAGRLSSPTASLMNIPGVDLGAVPTIGGALRGIDPSGATGNDSPEGRDS